MASSPHLRTSSKRALIAPALAVLAVLAGCTTQVNGNGVYGEVTVNLADFHGISIAGLRGPSSAPIPVKAAVTAGAASQSVVLSGDANVLQFIDLSVTNGILALKLQGVGSVDPTLPILITSRVKEFDSVDAGPAATVTVQDPTTPTSARADFVLTASGATVTMANAALSAALNVTADARSNVTVSGTGGGALAAQLGGSSHLDARYFLAASVDLQIKDSEAKVSVAPNGTASGKVEGTGELTIYGATCDGISYTPPASCTSVP